MVFEFLKRRFRSWGNEEPTQESSTLPTNTIDTAVEQPSTSLENTENAVTDENQPKTSDNEGKPSDNDKASSDLIDTGEPTVEPTSTTANVPEKKSNTAAAKVAGKPKTVNNKKLGTNTKENGKLEEVYKHTPRRANTQSYVKPPVKKPEPKRKELSQKGADTVARLTAGKKTEVKVKTTPSLPPSKSKKTFEARVPAEEYKTSVPNSATSKPNSARAIPGEQLSSVETTEPSSSVQHASTEIKLVNTTDGPSTETAKPLSPRKSTEVNVGPFLRENTGHKASGASGKFLIPSPNTNRKQLANGASTTKSPITSRKQPASKSKGKAPSTKTVGENKEQALNVKPSDAALNKKSPALLSVSEISPNSEKPPDASQKREEKPLNVSNPTVSRPTVNEQAVTGTNVKSSVTYKNNQPPTKAVTTKPIAKAPPSKASAKDKSHTLNVALTPKSPTAAGDKKSPRKPAATESSKAPSPKTVGENKEQALNVKPSDAALNKKSPALLSVSEISPNSEKPPDASQKKEEKPLNVSNATVSRPTVNEQAVTDTNVKSSVTAKNNQPRTKAVTTKPIAKAPPSKASAKDKSHALNVALTPKSPTAAGDKKSPRKPAATESSKVESADISTKQQLNKQPSVLESHANSEELSKVDNENTEKVDASPMTAASSQPVDKQTVNDSKSKPLASASVQPSTAKTAVIKPNEKVPPGKAVAKDKKNPLNVAHRPKPTATAANQKSPRNPTALTPLKVGSNDATANQKSPTLLSDLQMQKDSRESHRADKNETGKPKNLVSQSLEKPAVENAKVKPSANLSSNQSSTEAAIVKPKAKVSPGEIAAEDKSQKQKTKSTTDAINSRSPRNPTAPDSLKDATLKNQKPSDKPADSLESGSADNKDVEKPNSSMLKNLVNQSSNKPAVKDSKVKPLAVPESNQSSTKSTAVKPSAKISPGKAATEDKKHPLSVAIASKSTTATTNKKSPRKPAASDLLKNKPADATTNSMLSEKQADSLESHSGENKDTEKPTNLANAAAMSHLVSQSSDKPAADDEKIKPYVAPVSEQLSTKAGEIKSNAKISPGKAAVLDKKHPLSVALASKSKTAAANKNSPRKSTTSDSVKAGSADATTNSKPSEKQAGSLESRSADDNEMEKNSNLALTKLASQDLDKPTVEDAKVKPSAAPTSNRSSTKTANIRPNVKISPGKAAAENKKHPLNVALLSKSTTVAANKKSPRKPTAPDSLKVGSTNSTANQNPSKKQADSQETQNADNKSKEILPNVTAPAAMTDVVSPVLDKPAVEDAKDEPSAAPASNPSSTQTADIRPNVKISPGKAAAENKKHPLNVALASKSTTVAANKKSPRKPTALDSLKVGSTNSTANQNPSKKQADSQETQNADNKSKEILPNVTAPAAMTDVVSPVLDKPAVEDAKDEPSAAPASNPSSTQTADIRPNVKISPGKAATENKKHPLNVALLSKSTTVAANKKSPRKPTASDSLKVGSTISTANQKSSEKQADSQETQNADNKSTEKLANVTSPAAMTDVVSPVFDKPAVGDAKVEPSATPASNQPSTNAAAIKAIETVPQGKSKTVAEDARHLLNATPVSKPTTAAGDKKSLKNTQVVNNKEKSAPRSSTNSKNDGKISAANSVTIETKKNPLARRLEEKSAASAVGQALEKNPTRTSGKFVISPPNTSKGRTANAASTTNYLAGSVENKGLANKELASPLKKQSLDIKPTNVVVNKKSPTLLSIPETQANSEQSLSAEHGKEKKTADQQGETVIAAVSSPITDKPADKDSKIKPSFVASNNQPSAKVAVTKPTPKGTPGKTAAKDKRQTSNVGPKSTSTEAKNVSSEKSPFVGKETSLPPFSIQKSDGKLPAENSQLVSKETAGNNKLAVHDSIDLPGTTLQTGNAVVGAPAVSDSVGKNATGSLEKFVTPTNLLSGDASGPKSLLGTPASKPPNKTEAIKANSVDVKSTDAVIDAKTAAMPVSKAQTKLAEPVSANDKKGEKSSNVPDTKTGGPNMNKPAIKDSKIKLSTAAVKNPYATKVATGKPNAKASPGKKPVGSLSKPETTAVDKKTLNKPTVAAKPEKSGTNPKIDEKLSGDTGKEEYSESITKPGSDSKSADPSMTVKSPTNLSVSANHADSGESSAAGHRIDAKPTDIQDSTVMTTAVGLIADKPTVENGEKNSNPMTKVVATSPVSGQSSGKAPLINSNTKVLSAKAAAENERQHSNVAFVSKTSTDKVNGKSPRKLPDLGDHAKSLQPSTDQSHKEKHAGENPQKQSNELPKTLPTDGKAKSTLSDTKLHPVSKVTADSNAGTAAAASNIVGKNIRASEKAVVSPLITGKGQLVSTTKTSTTKAANKQFPNKQFTAYGKTKASPTKPVVENKRQPLNVKPSNATMDKRQPPKLAFVNTNNDSEKLYISDKTTEERPSNLKNTAGIIAGGKQPVDDPPHDQEAKSSKISSPLSASQNNHSFIKEAGTKHNEDGLPLKSTTENKRQQSNLAPAAKSATSKVGETFSKKLANSNNQEKSLPLHSTNQISKSELADKTTKEESNQPPKTLASGNKAKSNLSDAKDPLGDKFQKENTMVAAATANKVAGKNVSGSSRKFMISPPNTSKGRLTNVAATAKSPAKVANKQPHSKQSVTDSQVKTSLTKLASDNKKLSTAAVNIKPSKKLSISETQADSKTTQASVKDATTVPTEDSQSVDKPTVEHNESISNTKAEPLVITSASDPSSPNEVANKPNGNVSTDKAIVEKTKEPSNVTPVDTKSPRKPSDASSQNKPTSPSSTGEKNDKNNSHEPIKTLASDGKTKSSVSNNKHLSDMRPSTTVASKDVKKDEQTNSKPPLDSTNEAEKSKATSEKAPIRKEVVDQKFGPAISTVPSLPPNDKGTVKDNVKVSPNKLAEDSKVESSIANKVKVAVVVDKKPAVKPTNGNQIAANDTVISAPARLTGIQLHQTQKQPVSAVTNASNSKTGDAPVKTLSSPRKSADVKPTKGEKLNSLSSGKEIKKVAKEDKPAQASTLSQPNVAEGGAQLSNSQSNGSKTDQVKSVATTVKADAEPEKVMSLTSGHINNQPQQSAISNTANPPQTLSLSAEHEQPSSLPDQHSSPTGESNVKHLLMENVNGSSTNSEKPVDSPRLFEASSTVPTAAASSEPVKFGTDSSGNNSGAGSKPIGQSPRNKKEENRIFDPAMARKKAAAESRQKIVEEKERKQAIIDAKKRQEREEREKAFAEQRAKEKAERKAREERERLERERKEEEERKARILEENRRKAKEWAEGASKMLRDETENSKALENIGKVKLKNLLETAKPADRPAPTIPGSVADLQPSTSNAGGERKKPSMFSSVIKAAVQSKKEQEAEENRKKEAEQLLFDQMTSKEQLRYLLRNAASKEDAQRIAREFMMQQKIKDAQKKTEVDPVSQAELMMKKLREAHHAALLEEQRVLLEEKHRQEDYDRIKRGLPQRWGTVKLEDSDDVSTSVGSQSLQTSVRKSSIDMSASRGERARNRAKGALLDVIKETRNEKARASVLRPHSAALSVAIPIAKEDNSSGESDNEMVGGQGRIATPKQDPRKRDRMQPSIKQITDYTLKDPATYNTYNLKIKTNRRVFRKIKTPEDERPTPRDFWPWMRKNSARLKIQSFAAWIDILHKVRADKIAKEKQRRANEKARLEKEKARLAQMANAKKNPINSIVDKFKPKQLEFDTSKKKETALDLQTYDDVSDSDDEKSPKIESKENKSGGNGKKESIADKTANLLKASAAKPTIIEEDNSKSKTTGKKNNIAGKNRLSDKTVKKAQGKPLNQDSKQSPRKPELKELPAKAAETKLPTVVEETKLAPVKEESEKEAAPPVVASPPPTAPPAAAAISSEGKPATALPTSLIQQDKAAPPPAETIATKPVEDKSDEEDSRADNAGTSAPSEGGKKRRKKRRRKKPSDMYDYDMLDGRSSRIQSIKEETTSEHTEPVKKEEPKPVSVEPKVPVRVPDDRPPSVASGRVLTPDYQRPDTPEPPRPPSVPAAELPTTPEPIVTKPLPKESDKTKETAKTQPGKKRKKRSKKAPSQAKEAANDKEPAAAKSSTQSTDAPVEVEAETESKLPVASSDKPESSEPLSATAVTSTEDTSSIAVKEVVETKVTEETIAKTQLTKKGAKKKVKPGSKQPLETEKGEETVKPAVDKPKPDSAKADTDELLPAKSESAAVDKSEDSKQTVNNKPKQSDERAGVKKSTDNNKAVSKPGKPNTKQQDASKPGTSKEPKTVAGKKANKETKPAQPEKAKTFVPEKSIVESLGKPGTGDRTRSRTRTPSDLLKNPASGKPASGRFTPRTPRTPRTLLSPISRESTNDPIDLVLQANATSRFHTPVDELDDSDDELPAHFRLLASNQPSQQPKFSLFDAFGLEKHIPKRKGPPPPLTPDLDDISLDSVPFFSEPGSPDYSRPPTPPASVASWVLETPDYSREPTPTPSLPEFRGAETPDYIRIPTPDPSVGEPAVHTPFGSRPPTPPPSVAEARVETPYGSPPPTPEPSIAEARAETPFGTPPKTPEPSIAEARAETPFGTPPKTPEPSIAEARAETPFGTPPKTPEPSIAEARAETPTGTPPKTPEPPISKVEVEPFTTTQAKTPEPSIAEATASTPTTTPPKTPELPEVEASTSGLGEPQPGTSGINDTNFDSDPEDMPLDDIDEGSKRSSGFSFFKKKAPPPEVEPVRTVSSASSRASKMSRSSRTISIKRNGKMATVDIIKLRRLLHDVEADVDGQSIGTLGSLNPMQPKDSPVRTKPKKVVPPLPTEEPTDLNVDRSERYERTERSRRASSQITPSLPPPPIPEERKPDPPPTFTFTVPSKSKGKRAYLRPTTPKLSIQDKHRMINESQYGNQNPFASFLTLDDADSSRESTPVPAKETPPPAPAKPSKKNTAKLPEKKAPPPKPVAKIDLEPVEKPAPAKPAQAAPTPEGNETDHLKSILKTRRGVKESPVSKAEISSSAKGSAKATKKKTVRLEGDEEKPKEAFVDYEDLVDSDDEREKKRLKVKAKKDAQRQTHLNLLKNIEAYPGKPINKDQPSKLLAEKPKPKPAVPKATEAKPADTKPPPTVESKAPPSKPVSAKPKEENHSDADDEQEEAPVVQKPPEPSQPPPPPVKKTKLMKELKKAGAKTTDDVAFEDLFGHDPEPEDAESDKPKKRRRKKKPKPDEAEQSNASPDEVSKVADANHIQKPAEEVKEPKMKEPETVPPKKAEVLPKKEEVPPKKEEVPPKKETVPPKKEEVPPKKEEVPPKKEEVPPKKEEVPPKKEEVPPKTEMLPKKAEVSPITEDSPPKDTEAVAKAEVVEQKPLEPTPERATVELPAPEPAVPKESQPKKADKPAVKGKKAAEKKPDAKETNQKTEPKVAKKTEDVAAFNEQLKPKTQADPFLFDNNAATWQAASEQQIPKPEPVIIAPPEFKQDPEPEPSNEDAISIPTAEPETPVKKANTAVIVDKTVNSSQRKQKVDNKSPAKKEQKPAQTKTDGTKSQPTKLAKPEEDTVSIPIAQAETPQPSLSAEEKIEIDAVSIPPATHETPKKIVKPVVKTTPVKSEITPKAKPEVKPEVKPKSKAPAESDEKLPTSPRVEKKKVVAAGLSKPTKLSNQKPKPKETSEKKPAEIVTTKRTNPLDTYKHTSRNDPVTNVKPGNRYGIVAILDKDLAERENKDVPNGKVIPFGYKSMPPSPTKAPVPTASTQDNKMNKPAATTAKTQKPGATTSKDNTAATSSKAPVKPLKTPRKAPTQVPKAAVTKSPRLPEPAKRSTTKTSMKSREPTLISQATEEEPTAVESETVEEPIEEVPPPSEPITEKEPPAKQSAFRKFLNFFSFTKKTPPPEEEVNPAPAETEEEAEPEPVEEVKVDEKPEDKPADGRGKRVVKHDSLERKPAAVSRQRTRSESLTRKEQKPTKLKSEKSLTPRPSRQNTTVSKPAAPTREGTNVSKLSRQSTNLSQAGPSREVSNLSVKTNKQSPATKRKAPTALSPKVTKKPTTASKPTTSASPKVERKVEKPAAPKLENIQEKKEPEVKKAEPAVDEVKPEETVTTTKKVEPVTKPIPKSPKDKKKLKPETKKTTKTVDKPKMDEAVEKNDDEERPTAPLPSLINREPIKLERKEDIRPDSGSRFPLIEPAPSREGSAKSTKSTSSVSALPPISTNMTTGEMVKEEPVDETSLSLPSIHSISSNDSGIALEKNGQKSATMAPISEENVRISSSGPDKKSHEISPRRAAQHSHDHFSYYSNHHYSSNDDIMARFLQEAKQELEEEVKRSEKRNKPKRKANSPSHSLPVTASTRSTDYNVVRLAPHRHILGGGSSTASFLTPPTGSVPEPSSFQPINFKRAKALTRAGSLPKFDFPSLMDTPELLPVTPRLVQSTDNHLTNEEIANASGKKLAWKVDDDPPSSPDTPRNPQDIDDSDDNSGTLTYRSLQSSFAANSPRRNLNANVHDIQLSMDNSLKKIITAFNESNNRKIQARQQLEKAVHRRVNYNAPPAFEL